MARKRLAFIQRRMTLGFTQEQFAERAGVDRTTVCRWEGADTEPQPWQRPRLAQLLRVSVEELDHLLVEVVDRHRGASSAGDNSSEPAAPAAPRAGVRTPGPDG